MLLNLESQSREILRFQSKKKIGITKWAKMGLQSGVKGLQSRAGITK